MDPLLSLFGSDSELDCEESACKGSDLWSAETCLPPECEEGNVEYKLKLVNPTQSRFEHLVTQMKWRLREGQGEAIYEIGVEDKGLLVGLSEEEVDASMHTLYLMADKLGASLTILRERQIVPQLNEKFKFAKHCKQFDAKQRKVIEVLVRKVPDNQQTIELRIAVLGNVEVGKSTLLGVLTQGELDNGRGSARLNLFRHRHEIQSGRTSSISREILGFDSKGVPITYNVCRTPEEICESSSKLITFIDLGGHQKYLKTTVFGLIAMNGDYAVLCVSAIGGVYAGTTREHLGLALALDVPIIVVVNKVDLADEESLSGTVDQLETLLKSPVCKKIPIRVESEDDVINCASSLTSSNITPIFCVSCITGHGLDLFYRFLYVLSPEINSKDKENNSNNSSNNSRQNNSFETVFHSISRYVRDRDNSHRTQTQIRNKSELAFQVDETFQVPEVGPVIGGLLTSGMIKEGDSLQIGPHSDGSFSPVRVLSMQRHKVGCRVVRAGQTATLALTSTDGAINLERDLRRGMVLIEADNQKYRSFVCQYFQARVHVLFHATTIFPGFQTTVYIGNVRQTAIVVAIMGKKCIATNETASLMFRFIKQPEYVNPGCRLLFREGPSKGIGHVVQVFPLRSDTNNNF